MNIMSANPVCRYIRSVELDGRPVDALSVDLETGHIRYWGEAGTPVDAIGKICIRLESKDAKVSLDPTLSNELDKLLEQAKQHMARMSPEDQRKMYEEQKQSFIRAFTTPCEHGVLDFETCPKCRGV